MSSVRRIALALTLFSLTIAVMFPLAAHAGAPIGDPFTISAQPEQEVSPAIAYNTQRQEYLVVWYNDRPGNDDIRAQRLTRDGAPIGPPFYIANGAGAERRYPDVAYNATDDQYLVVWEHYDPASLSPGYGVYGRLVSGIGAVLGTSDIVIRDRGGTLYTATKPAVAWASTPDKFLVVWSEVWHSTIIWDIYGQVLDNTGALEGSRFSISSGADAREAPDLAYNHHANRYQVVWQQDAGSISVIYGQQVHGGGGLYLSSQGLTPPFPISFTAPAVACLPTNPSDDKFLVMWQGEDAAGDFDISGRLVAEDGTASSNVGSFAGTYTTGYSPAVAADDRAHRYLVFWRFDRGVNDQMLLGQQVSGGGDTQGLLWGFPGVVTDNPAVAGGPNGDFLVAWQDQPLPLGGTSWNIYGGLWGSRVYLPLVLRNY